MDVVAEGWATALAGAVVTVVVLGVIAEVMAFMVYAGGEEPRPSLLNFARLGGLIFYVFHHVGISFQASPSGADEFGFSAATIAFAALTGTLLGMWLLFGTGRRLGEETGGPGWVRGLHGAKVAVPYSLITVAFSFAVSVPRDAIEPPSPGVHPSYLAAFFWPFLLAALAGFAGGFRSAGEGRWPATRWGSWARSAVTGGAWMMGVGLLFAFVGLAMLGPFSPDVVGEYFSPFDDKTMAGVATIVGTVLVLPNLAAAVLFPAMGTCLAASGNFFGLGASVCLLSWTQFFPNARGDALETAINFPSPPAAFYLFLLVPLLAVVIGGRMAARRGGAASREQAMSMGALAGVAFGLLSLFVAILVSGTVRGGAGGFGQAFNGRVGPELFPGILWAFLWGIVGGAIGGLTEGRALPSNVRWSAPRVATSSPAPPPG